MAVPRKSRAKILFLVCGGALGIALLAVGSVQMVEFTDSTAFCGRLCHNIMEPEYTVYQDSPHSRVLCSECHVGPGASYLVKSKIAGVPMIVSSITGNVDRPIPVPVENLRPARETCEQCHRPERFAGDLVRTRTSYGSDEKNTAKVDTRVLRVGGGEGESARDIHWHIAARVWYLPLDKARQQIGWVGVEQRDGTMVQYADPQKTSEVTPQRLEEKRLMDCIDCHNRATHVFQSPNDLINASLAQGKIDSSLPFVKREALKALEPVNTSLDAAYGKLEAIKDFYRSSYPDVFSQKQQAVNQAVDELKTVARLTTFPDMKVTYRSYVNNLGHVSSPGCLRCHGKLEATTGDKRGGKVNADCTLCHYFQIPTK